MRQRRPHLVLLLAWPLALASGCQVDLERGLDDEQADRVVLALRDAGIAAEKRADPRSATRGGQIIRVARSDVGIALETLRAHGLPRAPARGFAEVFSKTNMVPTPAEERARLMEAIAGEIVRTLRSIDGVVDARAHVAIDERSVEPADPFATDKPVAPAKAAVLVTLQSGQQTITEEAVRRLTAGAVPGLKPESVDVFFSVRRQTPTTSKAAAPLQRWYVGALALVAFALVVSSLRSATLRRKLSQLEVRRG